MNIHIKEINIINIKVIPQDFITPIRYGSWIHKAKQSVQLLKHREYLYEKKSVGTIREDVVY